MTKSVKVYITLMSVLLISILLVSAAYLNTLNEKTDRTVASYNARREELLLRQQSLQEQIDQLNYTLEIESAINAELTRQVEELANKKITVETITPPPAPKPVPITPIITTRAS